MTETTTNSATLDSSSLETLKASMQRIRKDIEAQAAGAPEILDVFDSVCSLADFMLEDGTPIGESPYIKALPILIQSIIDDAQEEREQIAIPGFAPGASIKDIEDAANRILERATKNGHNKAEMLDVLPMLQSVIPQQHLIPNNKLTNALSADIIGAGRVAINVSKPKAKQPVDIICNLNYEGEKVKLTGRQSFTEYDRNVYNAVTSLFVFGDQSHIVTPAMVYRAMTGMNETENPSPQQIGAVTRSLDKIRFIRAVVDCTEEFKQRRIALNEEYVTNGVIDTYLLNASAVQIQAGGRSVRAYKIEKTPVLYAYSSALKQVYTVPAALLDVKTVDSKTGKATANRICNTESRIQVKGYLLRRIEGMKGKNALKNDVISLQSYDRGGKHHAGLYEIAGDSAPSRKDAKRIRDYAEDVLKFWRAEKYICGYCFTKSGQQTTGIKIML